MKTFHACPNCNNTSNGDSIYKCDDCNKLYCVECKPYTCGKCGAETALGGFGSNWYTYIGQIKR